MWNSNSTSYRIPDDLLEEIFLLLPVESILRCRCVSKHWRSILESKEFLERRTSLDQKSHLKLLVAHVCHCSRLPRLLPESSRLEGEEEMVYLHCKSPAWMSTCDGLICFPDPDWIHVLNPSTRQLRRFPIGIDMRQFDKEFPSGIQKFDFGRSYERGDWSMGFGRDKVTGSYKVVKICPSQSCKGKECSILGVETGEWLKISPLPSYVVDLIAKSVCVNGSVYWLYRWTKGFRYKHVYKLLALDLHKQEFHDVSVPASWITYDTQLANLEDRLVMAQTKGAGPEWMLEVLTMDAEEERWSKTYSISLASVSPKTYSINLAFVSLTTNRIPTWFRPIALSKQRDLFLHDNNNTLLKYNHETDEIRCLSSDTYPIAPYLENLVPLPLKSSHPIPLVLDDYGMFVPTCPFFDPSSWTSKTDDLITTLCTISMICILLFFYGF